MTSIHPYARELDEALSSMLSGGESEIFELKEAKNGYGLADIGRYFSALSNEALLRDAPYAWLVFGVRDRDRAVVGTGFRPERESLDSLKHEIGQNVSGHLTFFEIHEVQRNGRRVLMFQIPAAIPGFPTLYNGFAYSRQGESLVALPLDKMDMIRGFGNTDWSSRIMPEATMASLDRRAIEEARRGFVERNPTKAEEAAGWDDERFLAKTGFTKDGRVTAAAILLLGKAECSDMIGPNIRIRWIAKDPSGDVLDSELFGLPMILGMREAASRIVNYRVRDVGRGQLNGREMLRYDPFSIREAMCNCVLHQDYRREGMVDLIEFPNDHLVFSNVGSFLPGSVERVVLRDSPEHAYRNPRLAEVMRNIGLVDVAGGGVRKMFRCQIQRGFPLPRYDIGDQEVSVTIFGKVVDEREASFFRSDPDVSMETAIRVDRLLSTGDMDEADSRWLGELGIEAPPTSFRGCTETLSCAASPREVNDALRDAIEGFVWSEGPCTRSEIMAEIRPMLPAGMTESQVRNKVDNLLRYMVKHRTLSIRGARSRSATYSVIRRGTENIDRPARASRPHGEP